MQAGENFSPDIRIDKGLRNGKMLSEDVQLSITADEANEGNGSLWNFRAELR